MIILTRAEEIILLAIQKLKDDAYGVTIREQVYEDIGVYWAFGAIYKTLKKMKAKGYVAKIASKPLSRNVRMPRLRAASRSLPVLARSWTISRS